MFEKETLSSEQQDPKNNSDDEGEVPFSLPRWSQPTGYVDIDSTEISSMDRPIAQSNVGYQLLLKMGWKAGNGLGSSQQGRVDPIRIDKKSDTLGVGKQEEEDQYHLDSTAKRKTMDVEMLATASEEDKKKLFDKISEKEKIQDEIKAVTSVFYCELCDKQYVKISQYENHLSSYDHNHKKRFKDMKDKTKTSVSSIKKTKEKRREELEMEKLHKMATKMKESGETLSSILNIPKSPLQTSNSELGQSLQQSTGGWVQSSPATTASGTVPSNNSKGGWGDPSKIEDASKSTSSTTGGWTFTTSKVSKNLKPGTSKGAIKFKFGLKNKDN